MPKETGLDLVKERFTDVPSAKRSLIRRKFIENNWCFVLAPKGFILDIEDKLAQRQEMVVFLGEEP